MLRIYMKTTDTTFPQFMERVRASSSSALSPTKLAEALELPAQSLAELARVHRNTLQMRPESPKLQRAMQDVVRVLSAAHGLCGDMERALYWFRQYPIAEYGHRTAMDLVAEGKAQSVIDYIESIREVRSSSR